MFRYADVGDLTVAEARHLCDEARRIEARRQLMAMEAAVCAMADRDGYAAMRKPYEQALGADYEKAEREAKEAEWARNRAALKATLPRRKRKE